MVQITREDVLQKLMKIKGPDLEGDLVSLGLLSDIFIADGKVFFSITVPDEKANALESLRKAAKNSVEELEGVKSAIVTLTAEKKAGSAPRSIEKSQNNGGQLPNNIAESAKGHHRAAPAAQTPINRAAPAAQTPINRAAPAAQTPINRAAPAPKAPIDGVKHVIAVASGKGGVGKSTSAINIALALQAEGLRVGVLDADIYGPSLPRLTGLVNQKPETITSADNITKMKPLEKFGLKLISMGFLVEEEKPMVWRGPMVMSAVIQFLREVAWAPLDVLIVDMPPGTGDAQLTLAQQVQLTGAVIISTPQDLALIDARKGIEMFVKVGVPVLGVVENMSYFIAPDTGVRYDIFGHGGAKSEAEKRNVPFLAEVPLDPLLRHYSDSGEPIFVAKPESEHAKIYTNIAKQIKQNLT